MSVPVSCGEKKSTGRATAMLLVTQIALVSRGLKAENAALKANVSHRRGGLCAVETAWPHFSCRLWEETPE